MTWDAPRKLDENDHIISYTVCVSYSVDGHCFIKHVTNDQEREMVVRNLKASTKYYVRILANTAKRSSLYSESKGFLTNGSKYYKHKFSI